MMDFLLAMTTLLFFTLCVAVVRIWELEYSLKDHLECAEALEAENERLSEQMAALRGGGGRG